MQLVEPPPIVLVRDQAQGDRLGLLRREALLGEGHELAVDPGAKHVPGLDVQVGCAAIDRRLDDLLDAARLHVGAAARAAGFLLH